MIHSHCEEIAQFLAWSIEFDPINSICVEWTKSNLSKQIHIDKKICVHLLINEKMKPLIIFLILNFIFFINFNFTIQSL